MRAVIEAPQPIPPTYGVVAALLTGADEDEAVGRWGGFGVEFEAEQCGNGMVARTVCGSIPSRPAIANSPGLVQDDPFWVGAGDWCTSLQLNRDWQARARRQLLATRSFMIARELWKGTVRAAGSLEGKPLTDATSDTLTEAAEDPLDALACLEYGLGVKGQGRRGIIHCTTQLLTHWAAINAIKLQGATWMTHNGHLVVADAGYDGSGPGGVAANASGQWAYATSQMVLRLGPIDFTPGSLQEAKQQMDRSINRVEIVAGQLALVIWDECTHVAARVALPMCLIGGAS